MLLEAWRHLADDSYADAAVRAARGLADSVESWEDDSLYFGRTGMALALRAVHDDLGDTAAGTAADRALDLVRSRFDGTRWASCSN
ncbi:lanthionine synthetase LanC family protein [Streptomyces sp. MS1.AVA.1]|uniref:Lanthionine synthetase LanC family protein n=1 Tax=Streptomyces machairae TaxID=3134109 RepID=A0ABU8UTW8_9ACTN